MSNSIFQSVIAQLRDATDRTLGVIDSDGNVESVDLLGSGLDIHGLAIFPAA